jgi:hypothetical protein
MAQRVKRMIGFFMSQYLLKGFSTENTESTDLLISQCPPCRRDLLYLNRKSVFKISGIGTACEYRYAPVGCD